MFLGGLLKVISAPLQWDVRAGKIRISMKRAN
jgi:hypothetical protein